eukprot:Tbor_TRINITY_DN5214_c5_g2::TRINITY_DN5214_c5_g2_i1::g.16084::m.16084/K07565/NIP7; 60S ribosome subunit biogenesis protein NIP7
MRCLTEEETKQLIEKLAKYIGPNTKHLFCTEEDPENDSESQNSKNKKTKKRNKENNNNNKNPWVLRLHKSRIWYLPLSLAKLSSSISNKNLCGLGTLLAKQTHAGHIRIQITALEILARYALYKVWVKPSQEQSFLYGGHVTRGGLGRITEGVPQYTGVCVYSMGDIPLGFGVAAVGTVQA